MNKDNGVVVVGSLHYDIFLNTTHQPSKGETIFGKYWFPKFGGKGGNQAIASSLFGSDTKIVSAIGDDNFGEYILGKIDKTNVNTEFIQVLKNENYLKPTVISLAPQFILLIYFLNLASKINYGVVS